MDKVTIGCDLGDKTSTICLLLGKEQAQRQTVQTTPQAFRAFFSRPTCHVVLEAGQHSRWVSTLLKKLGHQVTVANPRQVQLIAQNQRKTDQRDAELLARLGRADVSLLAPIEHRSDRAHSDLAIAKARDGLVGVRTDLINMVRGMVKPYGVKLPKCTTESFHRRNSSLIPESLKPALTPVFQTLEQLELQIKALDKQIEQTAKGYPEIQTLTQVNGVGTLTAFVFVLTLENEERFCSSRMVGPYLGLVPKRNQSGESDPGLAITKAGNPLLRRLLVGSANYILGPFGKPCDLRTFGEKLAARGGKHGRRRAKVAVARKLAVLLHALWRTRGVYVPSGYKIPARAA